MWRITHLAHSLPGMNATVLAAVIGVSGTVVVGVAGFGAVMWNTSKTIAHAREARLWDQRANVYVDAIAAIRNRQLKRDNEIKGPSQLDSESVRHLQAYLASYKQPEWHQLEARLTAFGTDAVIQATRNSIGWHAYATDTYRESQAVGDTENQGSKVAMAAAEKAVKSAQAADDFAILLIRRELQDRAAKGATASRRRQKARSG